MDYSVDNITSCQDCSVRYFCSGGCIATNYKSTNNICSSRSQCQLYKKLLETLIWKTDSYTEEELLKLL